MTVWDSAVVGKWRNTGITDNTVYRSKPTAYLNKTIPKFILSPIWHQTAIGPWWLHNRWMCSGIWGPLYLTSDAFFAAKLWMLWKDTI